MVYSEIINCYHMIFQKEVKHLNAFVLFKLNYTDIR